MAGADRPPDVSRAKKSKNAGRKKFKNRLTLF
jgi:hypothetical protein